MALTPKPLGAVTSLNVVRQNEAAVVKCGPAEKSSSSPCGGCGPVQARRLRPATKVGAAAVPPLARPCGLFLSPGAIFSRQAINR